MSGGFQIELPPEALEAIAERVLERLQERLQENEDGFLDVAGAAAYRRCPSSRIYALVSAKRLPHYKDGSRLLFDRRELKNYVRRGGAPALKATDAYRAGHRRAVTRERRAEFERRLAERDLECTCRRPDAINPAERCTRCYGSPGGLRHVCHALAGALGRLAPEGDR